MVTQGQTVTGEGVIFPYFLSTVTDGDMRLFSSYWHHLNHRKHTCEKAWFVPHVYKLSHQGK
jgi:hypothetical protein